MRPRKRNFVPKAISDTSKDEYGQPPNKRRRVVETFKRNNKD